MLSCNHGRMPVPTQNITTAEWWRSFCKKHNRNSIWKFLLQSFLFHPLLYSRSYINVSFGPSRTVELQTKGLKGPPQTKGKREVNERNESCYKITDGCGRTFPLFSCAASCGFTSNQKYEKNIFLFLCVCFHLILITESGGKVHFHLSLSNWEEEKKFMILELIRSRVEVETMIDGLKKNVWRWWKDYKLHALVHN
jgi:hypothetical protein